MQVNNTVSSEKIDNLDLFPNEFFRRFPRTPYSLELASDVIKQYHFPTYYGNVTSAVAIFTCSYAAARGLLAHPSLKPVRVGPGRSLVVFNCYRYRAVSEMRPFNEVAVAIPVTAGARFDLPLLPALFPRLFPNAGFHVVLMPETSLENKIRGDKIWGLPKVVHEVSYEEDASTFTCRVSEPEAEAPYLCLTVPKAGRAVELDTRVSLFTARGASLLRAHTSIQGRFRVATPLWRSKPAPGGRAAVMLGASGAADVLRRLDIGRQPLQTRFGENVCSCFGLPDPEFRS